MVLLVFLLVFNGFHVFSFVFFSFPWFSCVFLALALVCLLLLGFCLFLRLDLLVTLSNWKQKQAWLILNMCLFVVACKTNHLEAKAGLGHLNKNKPEQAWGI